MPGTSLISTPAVTLVYNDKVKEIRTEKLTVMGKHFLIGFFFAVRFVVV